MVHPFDLPHGIFINILLLNPVSPSYVNIIIRDFSKSAFVFRLCFNFNKLLEVQGMAANFKL